MANMVYVKNTRSSTVKEHFPGHGPIEIEPGAVEMVPEDIWKAWKEPNFWGFGECPLKEVSHKCKVCGDRFETPIELANHAKAAHSPKKADKKGDELVGPGSS